MPVLGQRKDSLDVLDDFGGRDTGFAAADGSGEDGSGLVITGQDLGDTSVRHSQLAADVTGSDSQLSHFDDSDTDVVGKRPAVHEDSSELVHFAVSMTGIHGREWYKLSGVRRLNEDRMREAWHAPRIEPLVLDL